MKMYRIIVMPLPGKGMRNRPQQIQVRKDSGVVRGQIHLPRNDVYDFLQSIKPPTTGLTRSIQDLMLWVEGDKEVDLEETLGRLQRYHALLQRSCSIEGTENVEAVR